MGPRGVRTGANQGDQADRCDFRIFIHDFAPIEWLNNIENQYFRQNREIRIE